MVRKALGKQKTGQLTTSTYTRSLDYRGTGNCKVIEDDNQKREDSVTISKGDWQQRRAG
jgi:hypothetical protein